jgi:integrase/recombinase XerD
MGEIRWALYPRAAARAEARAWVELQRQLLRAPKTIDAYARGVDDFLGVCARLAIDVGTATRSDIAAYVDDLAHRPRVRRRGDGLGDVGLAHRTLQLRLTVVRLFYDFLVDRGQRASNPVGRGQYTAGGEFWATRARALVPRRERPPWNPSDAEWAAFLDALLATESLRNQLLAYLAYDGALRRGELLALTVADVDFPHQLLRIRPETAENHAGRIVCYGDATSALLVAYLARRQALIASTSGAPRGRPRAGRGALFLYE